jgi:ABC-type branched-subunit amino acid transport system substrate-binding protein
MAFLSSGCNYLAPIRIGFTAELSGKQNDLAINLRNGVQLAVDDINATGGIKDRSSLSSKMTWEHRKVPKPRKTN